MPTAAEFVTQLEALRTLDPAEGQRDLQALRTRMSTELDDDDPFSEQVWTVFGSVRSHLDGEMMLRSADPIASAVAGKRPDVVTRIGTDAAFNCAIEQATIHIAKEYYDTKAGWIHAAAQLATTPHRRTQVVALYSRSIQSMITARLKGGDLINSVAFGACARSLITLKPSEAVETLDEALRFCVKDECHYEAMQEAGAVAMALAAAEAKDSIPAMNEFLERWESVYPGERFVMEVLYARWLLEGNIASAIAFLNDSGNTKGQAFAVAALADLNAKGGLSVIEAKFADIRNPVTREVFAEGLARLREQNEPPNLIDRMVFLFGAISPTEQALGMYSDNVFLQRARLKANDSELGRVIEVDDSAADDESGEA